MTELDQAYEEMGNVNEKLYKPIIERIYGRVLKTEYKFAGIDFIGKNFSGELKTRDLNHNTFEDTMIGNNKITKGFKNLLKFDNDKYDTKYRVFFWFGFKDGLYVWELTKEAYELNGGDTKIKIGGTCKRGKDDYKDHYYINVEHLVKIDDTPCWVHPLVDENSKRRVDKPATGINPALLGMLKKAKLQQAY
jgi:hypothetical protein